jgi:hypothetical protein
MLIKTKFVGEYSNSYDFVNEFTKEKDFNKVLEILKIKKEDVDRYMKENDEEDRVMALFEVQIGEYSISDSEVIEAILEKEKDNYYFEYIDDNDGYFKVYKVIEKKNK